MTSNAQNRPPKIFALIAVMFAITMVALMLGRWQSSQARSGRVSEAPSSASPKVDVLERTDSGVTILNSVAKFDLIDQEGSSFSTELLSGKVWVGNFVFTNCQTMCPMLTRHMKRLQEVVGEEKIPGIHLVSFSVDPLKDTPEVLKQYSLSYKVDFSNWSFLTGSPQVIYQLSKDSFKLAVTADSSNAAMPILHTEMFVLVDDIMRVRGFYDPSTDAGRTRLIQDLKRVRSEAAVAKSSSAEAVQEL
jgi:protein SCO1/2